MTLERFTVAGLMHGLDYSGEECAGWLAQRKWDGWFALWDGERLRTREGNIIPAPDFFLAGLPDFPLCCELVAGKEGANFTQSLVRNPQSTPEWRRAKLYVFDAPTGAGGLEERLYEAMSRFTMLTTFAEFTRTTVIEDREHLRSELGIVLGNLGEGLMIQPPDHPYTAGRSRRLLKVKRQSLHFLRSDCRTVRRSDSQ